MEYFTVDFIKQERNRLFSLRRELVDPMTFVYTPEIKKIDDEMKELQNHCQHNLENNLRVCPICGYSEPMNKQEE